MNYEDESKRAVESAKPAMYAIFPKLDAVEKSLSHTVFSIWNDQAQPNVAQGNLQKVYRVHAAVKTAVEALRTALRESERPA